MILRFPLLGMALGLLTACTTSTSKSPSDAFSLDLTADTLSIVAPGTISTALQERDMAIAPTGNLLIFTRGNFDQTVRVLLSMERSEQQWLAPTVLPFSGEYNDIEPAWTPDGQRLFFASDRPLPGEDTPGDYNLWVVDKTPAGWGTPQALDTLINTPADEFYPSLTASGTLYFTAAYPGGMGTEDIYRSEFRDGWQTPVPLDTAVNSRTYEFNAYISPQEDVLLFSAYGRPDDLGGGDLYLSRKDPVTGQWLPAQHLPAPINSAQLDYCPFIDWLNQAVYFTSNRRGPVAGDIRSVAALAAEANQVLNGMGNIYRFPLQLLPE